MKISDYPKCEQERNNCMFANYGKCTILKSTKFKRPCPFYKPKSKEVK